MTEYYVIAYELGVDEEGKRFTREIIRGPMDMADADKECGALMSQGYEGARLVPKGEL